MTQDRQNALRGTLVSIALIAFSLLFLRQFINVQTIPDPPPVNEDLIAALEEISSVDEEFIIPFTGAFCQNLVPTAPEIETEARRLYAYQPVFIGAAITEDLPATQKVFAPLFESPDTPPLARYLALTKTAWLALRVRDLAVADDAFTALAAMPLEGIRPCYQADVAYLQTFSASQDDAFSLLHQTIALNPLHVPALAQLVSRRVPMLQNPEQKAEAFQDIVRSMAVLRKVSGAQIFATRLTAEIPDGSCGTAECRFIRALFLKWSNADNAATQALQELDSYCRAAACAPELLVVSRKLQDELLEASP